MPAYITEVREQQWRLGLAELSSRVHWRLRSPAMRHCRHCAAAGQPGLVEDTHNVSFSSVSCTTACVLPTRPTLPPGEEPTLGPFWQPPPPHTPVCRRHPAARVGSQRSGSLDCLCAALIYFLCQCFIFHGQFTAAGSQPFRILSLHFAEGSMSHLFAVARTYI